MPMKEYPKVMGEFETVERILKHKCSIARFGDGEVKLMDGGSQIREPKNEALAKELRLTMVDPDPRLLIGIPTMDPRSPKIVNWKGREARTLTYLSENVPQYYSAFISRPDSAPWILTRAYAEKIVDIWRNRRVAIICEEDNKLYTAMRKTASGGLRHFPCPHTQTYAIIDQLEADMVKGKFEVVVMSCGPAATCLARRLHKRGIQGIDLGSIGGTLLKLLDLEPLGDLRTVVLQRPQDLTVEQMKAKLRSDGWVVKYFDERDE